MKYFPLPFSVEMVRQVLRDRKDTTRRVLRKELPGKIRLVSTLPNPDKLKRAVFLLQFDAGLENVLVPCPYGSVGQGLYIREPFILLAQRTLAQSGMVEIKVRYAADDADGVWVPIGKKEFSKLGPKPGMFLPKTCSRIIAVNSGVDVEHLQRITRQDVRREGVYWGSRWSDSFSGIAARAEYGEDIDRDIAAFALLWDRLNEKRGYGWLTDPPVFRIRFERKPYLHGAALFVPELTASA